MVLAPDKKQKKVFPKSKLKKNQAYLTKVMETFTSISWTYKQSTPKETTHHMVETFAKVFKNELQKEEHIEKKLPQKI